MKVVERLIGSRLYPTIFHPDYLHLVGIRKALQKHVIHSPAPEVVVDIGAGSAPYRPLFDGCRYITVDQYAPADIRAPAENVPLSDGCADKVVCLEVLEHLEDPETALRETYRLLKPGGVLILTTPWLFPYHACPSDYQRYSYEKLGCLLRKAGYRVVAVEPISGRGTTFCKMATWIVPSLGHRLRYLTVGLSTLLLNPLGILIDATTTPTLDYTLGYISVAAKPMEST